MTEELTMICLAALVLIGIAILRIIVTPTRSLNYTEDDETLEENFEEYEDEYECESESGNIDFEQQGHTEDMDNVYDEIASSEIIERCSEIIDAYCKLSTVDFFGMSVGNIWVVIPKPQYERLMGNLFAPSQEIEVIFDTYYDCCLFPEMLARGVQSLVSMGVPQVLIDRKASVSLDVDREKVKWIVKTYPPAGLYGMCDSTSFESMYGKIENMLKSRYSNIKKIYPLVNLIITPLPV